MIRTQIQLSEKQATALKKVAKYRHVSMATVVRESVDRYLKGASPIDPEERKRRAIAASGRFRSSVRDLSVNHDKYLAEIYGK